MNAFESLNPLEPLKANPPNPRTWWRTPLAAWIAIVCLSLFSMWGIWDHMDLMSGDTAGYFSRAAGWRETRTMLKVNYMVYSPLYTVFYGEMQRAFSDPYAATILHRMLIVVCSAACVLGVARNLLPPATAWFVAAWWTVLPINWAGLYEVHLFNFMLLALGCWVAGAGLRIWWRAWALAVLLSSGAFVRNEFLLAYILFAASNVAFELIQVWKKRIGLKAFGSNFFRLFAPSTGILLAAFALFSGNPKAIKWSAVADAFKVRQRANMVQVYAFAYQQRHPEWDKDPFTQGAELMTRDFGAPDAKWSEALRSNPANLIRHIAWNLSLFPAGLELGLFNGYTGKFTPDFIDHPSEGTWPLFALCLMGILWFAAGSVWRSSLAGRPQETRRGFGPAMWSIAALVCCLPPCVAAIMTQRPRPSYIMILLLGVMLLTGWSVAILARQLQKSPFRLGAPLIYLPFLALVGYFCFERTDFGARRLLQDYRTLEPYKLGLQGRKRVICMNAVYPLETVFYLCGAVNKCPRTVPWQPVEAWMASGHTLEEAAEHFGLTDLFLKGAATRMREVADWRQSVGQAGWTQTAQSSGQGGEWVLLSRNSPSANPN